MSDENEDFDKEAEKRRLREKYEQDQEDREATGRMSDLLLQGATMTNKHCDTCGDPIFRYQGEEFCPTCRAEGQEQAQARQQAQTQSRQQAQQQVQRGQAQQSQRSQQRAEQPEAPVDATGRASTERTATAQQDVEPSRPPAPTGSGSGSGASERADGTQGERQPTGRAERAERSSRVDQTGTESSGSLAGGLGAARADLARTVSTMARRAEDADDPRTAREYLEAAREAAEALATLPR